jgi:hypothetical protein
MRTRSTSLSVGFLFAALLGGAASPPPYADHPRLPHTVPAGQREILVAGHLFIPQKLLRKKRMPLLVHFHGAAWVAESAAAKDGRWAVISVESGEGADVYARQFSDHTLFGKILDEASRKTGIRFDPIVVSAWSAGYGAVREILEVPADYRRVDKVLLLDGLHADYAAGKPGTAESALDAGNLGIFLKFARDAVARRKTMVVIHSEIMPETYASTTETAEWLLARLKLMRRPLPRPAPGPLGMREMSEVRAGKFRVMGYAGQTAEDHVAQFESLPWQLRLLW